MSLVCKVPKLTWFSQVRSLSVSLIKDTGHNSQCPSEASKERIWSLAGESGCCSMDPIFTQAWGTRLWAGAAHAGAPYRLDVHLFRTTPGSSENSGSHSPPWDSFLHFLCLSGEEETFLSKADQVVRVSFRTTIALWFHFCMAHVLTRDSSLSSQSWE